MPQLIPALSKEEQAAREKLLLKMIAGSKTCSLHTIVRLAAIGK